MPPENLHALAREIALPVHLSQRQPRFKPPPPPSGAVTTFMATRSHPQATLNDPTNPVRTSRGDVSLPRHVAICNSVEHPFAGVGVEALKGKNCMNTLQGRVGLCKETVLRARNGPCDSSAWASPSPVGQARAKVRARARAHPDRLV